MKAVLCDATCMHVQTGGWTMLNNGRGGGWEYRPRSICFSPSLLRSMIHRQLSWLNARVFTIYRINYYLNCRNIHPNSPHQADFEGTKMLYEDGPRYSTSDWENRKRLKNAPGHQSNCNSLSNQFGIHLILVK
jgi:hypothetical protein